MLPKLIALFTAALLSTAVLANDEHHPEGDKKPGAAQPVPKPSKAPAKKVVAPSETEKQFAAARDQMKKMLSQMDKIKQTKDSKERERLMQEHLQSMREGSQAMRGTGGGMMMNMMDCPMMADKGDKADKGGMQSCPMMGGSSSKMGMDKRVDMMEKRMDMMQMMMDQMIERESQKSSKPQQ
ncbi:MAG: hypothetical protein HYS18_17680 [Burkholderiales bacterium]|nr:hypothetical protein [Burkholderiales bacterium]